MANAWEVELKLSVDDIENLEQRLRIEGFNADRVEEHCDTYFRHPCRDFHSTDEAFRLRRIDEQACVTYKGPRRAGPVKTRPEIELSISASEFEQWYSMIKALGFEPLPSVRKHRHVYRHARRSMLVVVDQVERLGAFAELEEVVTSEAALPTAQTRIQELAKTLGLRRVVGKSYLAQLLELLGIE